jgi:hypothetical protein
LATLSNLERREIGTIAIRYLTDLTEGYDSPCDNTASFRITDRRLNFDQTGKKFGDERSNSDMGVDELGHIVDNTTKI